MNRVQSRGARPAAPKPHSPSIPLLPLSVGPKFQEGGGLTFQTQVLVGLQVFSIRCPPCEEVHPKVCQYSYQIQSCLRPFLGFPGGSVVKDLPASSGDDPWVGKIPLRRKWQPTARFLPGKSHRQRSLACCSPWGHKELDTTWRLKNKKTKVLPAEKSTCVFSPSEHFLKLDSVLQVKEGRKICRCLVALPTWA